MMREIAPFTFLGHGVLFNEAPTLHFYLGLSPLRCPFNESLRTLAMKALAAFLSFRGHKTIDFLIYWRKLKKQACFFNL